MLLFRCFENSSALLFSYKCSLIISYFIENLKFRIVLTLIFLVEKILDFSRRSDNLSEDFSSSFASIISRVAVDRRVYLSIERAEFVFHGESHFVSFVLAVIWDVIIVAGRPGVRVLQLLEDLAQSRFISSGPFVVFNAVKYSLELVLNNIFLRKEKPWPGG